MITRTFYGIVACLLLFGAIQACKTPASVPVTAEVQFVDNPGSGLVSLSATGFGSSEDLAIENAYFTAFNTVFFTGLPQFTALRVPMVANESKAKSEHGSYFKKFYQNGYYLRFVTERLNPAISKSANDRKMKAAKMTFTLNYEALRKDLEQNNIIRKFGL